MNGDDGVQPNPLQAVALAESFSGCRAKIASADAAEVDLSLGRLIDASSEVLGRRPREKAIACKARTAARTSERWIRTDDDVVRHVRFLRRFIAHDL